MTTDNVSSVWAWPLARFRDALAGLEPVPSCGATAAVCGNLGLALIVMALGKSQAREAHPARETLLAEARALLPVLAAHADGDMRDFGRFIEDLPHTEPEDAQRQRDLAVLVNRTHQAAQDAQRALELAVTALPLATPSLRCDVRAGGLMLHASVHALLLNLAEDAPLLQDPGRTDQYEAQRAAIGNRADIAARALRERFERSEAKKL
ncbi:cyclodeaminase/cyclohydrolase family protein [Pseudomonas sp. Marseille-Q5115]|uniref:cyclodeaminase/cyclohydrolase family protein n=1 Tax=Pseudomonas sp. Marseille-Q5115 TaxID=2866593 RepID=UPI001CE3DA6F|nr:cyclodeaminase/cyclohydrolase family protein [Pseudomonas sp. Marseille-Q5115]